VTFQTDTGVTAIPLVIEYRDDDGNLYTATRPISLENRTGEEEGDGGIAVPAAVAVVLIVAAGLVIFWYIRRRRR
jgi:uncharacterized protein HemX